MTGSRSRCEERRLWLSLSSIASSGGFSSFSSLHRLRLRFHVHVSMMASTTSATARGDKLMNVTGQAWPPLASAIPELGHFWPVSPATHPIQVGRPEYTLHESVEDVEDASANQRGLPSC